VSWSAKRAAHITTISEHARADLLDLFDWLDLVCIMVLLLVVDVWFCFVVFDCGCFGLFEVYVVCLGVV